MVKQPSPQMVITAAKEAMFMLQKTEWNARKKRNGNQERREMQTFAVPWLGEAMREKLP